MAILDTIVTIAVSLLLGGSVLFVGLRLVADDTLPPESAFLTAATGAVAWGAVALYAGRVPIVAPLSALVVWIVVLALRYPGGWATAAVLGFVAWLASVGALYALGTMDVVSLSALGVPEV
ncbi:hypothetical protein [Halococcus agarilyticus]|uniref:hypothetical protein n=1 Tax=Halococcus agarilyticus TaxID=1232219 RepID=UPI000677C2A4|nr:hypothetical protein [Halococcus agarilyticus]